MVVLDSKDEAEGCVNDLYNIKGDENVYFFPTSDVRTVKGTMKDMSAKVQRTAAISALRDYSHGAYKGDFLIIVGYKDAVDENIPDDMEMSRGIIKVSAGSEYPFEKLQDDLYGLGFTRVDFVSRPGEYAVRGGIIDLFPTIMTGRTDLIFRGRDRYYPGIRREYPAYAGRCFGYFEYLFEYYINC